MNFRKWRNAVAIFQPDSSLVRDLQLSNRGGQSDKTNMQDGAFWAKVFPTSDFKPFQNCSRILSPSRSCQSPNRSTISISRVSSAANRLGPELLLRGTPGTRPLFSLPWQRLLWAIASQLAPVAKNWCVCLSQQGCLFPGSQPRNR